MAFVRTELTCVPASWDVLVVDDDPESRKVATALLTLHRIKVKTVETVLEGLQSIRDNQHNILLLDLMLADDAADGWEIHRQLHHHEKAIRDSIVVVAFTALTTKEDLDTAAREGFDGFISKPVDSATMIALLGAFVGVALEKRGRPCFPTPQP